MTMLEREKIQERAQEELNQWKEKYDIPEHLEFHVTTLLELQWEFKTTSSEHTKRRMDLLDMIRKIESGLPRDIFKVKSKLETKDKKKLLIACDSEHQIVHVHKVLSELTGNDVINFNHSVTPIESEKYVIRICKSKEELRGKRADVVWNLTEDKDVAEILTKILKDTFASYKQNV